MMGVGLVDRALVIVQDAPIAHQSAPGRGGGDAAKGIDTILQGHADLTSEDVPEGAVLEENE